MDRLEYNIPLRFDDELEHHGILGQKWGKRHGPPYPLDPEDRSAAEKKAAKSKNLRLTDGQKRAIAIGATAAATALGIYGAYKLGTLDSLPRVHPTLEGSLPDTDFKKTTKPVTEKMKRAEEVARKISPRDNRENCFSNALAICYALAGYEVGSTNGSSDNIGALSNIFGYDADSDNTPKERRIWRMGFSSETNADKVTKSILRRTNAVDGSFGILGLNYSDSFIARTGIHGHAINWCYEGGVMHYFAVTQDGKSELKDFKGYLSSNYTKSVDFVRLDTVIDNPEIKVNSAKLREKIESR